VALQQAMVEGRLDYWDRALQYRTRPAQRFAQILSMC
jgi:hypothetical protein